MTLLTRLAAVGPPKLRSAIYRRRLLRAPLRHAASRATPASGPVSLLPPEGGGVRMNLQFPQEVDLWLTSYERDVIDVMREHIDARSVVYDVGARAGYHTLLAAAYGAQVVAFEPFEANRRVLEENLKLNPSLSVRIVDVALGASRATTTIGTAADGNDRLGEGTQPVEVWPLDAYVADGGLRPTFLKIDVDGAEGDVLDGAVDMLRDARPIVVCEVHDDVNARRVVERLRALSYDIELLPDRRPIRSPVDMRVPDHGAMPHVVALPS